MQYADIIVKAKTGSVDKFTYAIPAKDLPYAQIGSLVEVPFSNRKTLGVIYQFKKRTTKLDPNKIKPVIRIIDSEPILDQTRLDLAQKISHYYLSSLGKVVFSMIPAPAIRKAKPDQIASPSNQTTARPTRSPVLILGQVNFRLKKYLKIVKKLKNKQQGLILLASIDSSIAERIKKKYPNAVIYHTRLTTSQKYSIWQKVRAGKIKLIIGTRQALFLPFKNLKAIMFDQITSDFYQNDQEPFYDLRLVSNWLAKSVQARLFYGDICPTFPLWLKSKKENWPVIKQKRKSKSKIVDLSNQPGLLSQPLRQAIQEQLNQSGQTVLFYNRLGNQRLAICQACQKSFYLAVDANQIRNCSACNSTNLKFSSLGTRGLAKQIQEEFPKAKIRPLDSQLSLAQQKTVINEKVDITIATSKIFQFDKIFDLVGVVLPEISLAFPTYDIWEKTYYTLAQASSIGNNTIVQTFNPDLPLISQASLNNYPRFFNQEVKKRQQNNLPPYRTIIKLYYREKDDSKIQQTYQKLADWAKAESEIEVQSVVQPVVFKWPYFIINCPTQIPYSLQKKLQQYSNLKIDRDPKDLF